jgi:hypothetical protein
MAKSTEKRKKVGLFQRFFHASVSTFPPFPTFSAFANFYNRKISIFCTLQKMDCRESTNDQFLYSTTNFLYVSFSVLLFCIKMNVQQCLFVLANLCPQQQWERVAAGKKAVGALLGSEYNRLKV